MEGVKSFHRFSIKSAPSFFLAPKRLSGKDLVCSPIIGLTCAFPFFKIWPEIWKKILYKEPWKKLLKHRSLAGIP